MLTNSDLRQIEERGSSKAVVAKQLESFRKGFPWMKIVGPATPERGILVLSEAEAKAACKYSDEASVAGRCKFVPASGAASRMFKDIFAGLSILEGGSDIVPDSPAARLCSSIEKFAFYSEALFGAPADSPAWRKDVLSKVLGEPGLGYGSKPKGVILFHRYPSEVRTAFAEHLVEAQEYMRNQDGSCNLMVTISPEHKPLFEKALADVKEAYEKRYGVRYNIVFTFQDKATDTIAADPTGKPFRTSEGKLLFRPAGHGALIHNLNAVEQELVSIKNIDNVACERFLPVTSLYKKVLMGKALELRDRIFAYLRRFDSLEPGTEAFHMLCNEVENFLDKVLCVQVPLARSEAERAEILRAKLDRPIRVCGMVRNEGEPGGGPFIIAGRDGSTSLQILESVQINPEASDVLSRATHFNPVDLVCCLRDYRGRKFDLLKYVDEQAGFISSKSFEGKELRALELPGLWNGSMSDWNTLFVEVPSETFNPVKTVLDLLRPAHQ